MRALAADVWWIEGRAADKVLMVILVCLLPLKWILERGTMSETTDARTERWTTTPRRRWLVKLKPYRRNISQVWKALRDSQQAHEKRCSPQIRETFWHLWSFCLIWFYTWSVSFLLSANIETCPTCVLVPWPYVDGSLRALLSLLLEHNLQRDYFYF